MKELNPRPYYCSLCGRRLKYLRMGVIYYCPHCQEESANHDPKEPIPHKIIRLIVEKLLY